MDTAVLASGKEAVDLVNLTVDLLSAYVDNNSVPHAEFPSLVGAVHAALAALGQPRSSPVEAYTPAVPVKKSVSPDAIVSLIDGKPYKTLKRHLAGHGLTPTDYRRRYGLPADYPMSAPNYSAQRSEMARRIGLGASRRGPASTAETAAAVPQVNEAPDPARGEPTPRRRGTRKAGAEPAKPDVAVGTSSKQGGRKPRVRPRTPHRTAPEGPAR